MSQPKLVLVTGATGKQGGAVVEALLIRGHQVRALTRNSAPSAANRLREQGVEIAVGDFTDHDSLVRAARGVDAVYAMGTPYEEGSEKETAQGITLTDSAKTAGVAHLIYSQSRCPGPTGPVGCFSALERYLIEVQTHKPDSGELRGQEEIESIAKECLALVIGEGHADVVKEVKPNSISESGAQMLKRVQELLTRSDCTVYLVE